MTRQISKIEKRLYYFSLISVFIVLWAINSHVKLYGDDWYYYFISQKPIKEFFQSHFTHYMEVNGRGILHVLACIFLKLPPIFWQVLNAFFLMTIGWGINKISCEGQACKAGKKYSKYMIPGLFIIFFYLSTMDGEMTRQSVFWITGSFNYVYPVCLFIIFLYVYLYKKDRIGLLVVSGFFAAATMEQMSMVVFGFIILTIFDKVIIQKNKIDKIDLAVLISTLLGAVSVIFAPGVFTRVGLEDNYSQPFLDLFISNLKFQNTLFMFSETMLPVHIIILGGGIRVIIYKHKEEKLNLVDKLVSAIGILGIIGLSDHYLFSTTNINNVVFDIKHILFVGFVDLGYIIFIFYLAYLVYKYKWIQHYQLPLFLLILAFGAQIMMLVSPVFGYRNLLLPSLLLVFSGMMMIGLNISIYSPVWIFLVYYFYTRKVSCMLVCVGLLLLIFILSKWKEMQGKRQILQSLALVIVLLMAVMYNLRPTYIGHKENEIVYEENVKRAQETDSYENDVLIQKTLPHNLSRWAMPYENSYYDSYYNLYLDVDVNQEVKWIEE